MRHLLIVCVLVASCGPKAAAPDLGDAYRYPDVVWDFHPVEWSDDPVIVVVGPRTAYPSVPDVLMSLACRGDGSVHVGGAITHIAQDLGYIEPPTRMGLASRSQSVDAPAVWTGGGFGVVTDLVLQPKSGQLREILTGGPVYLTQTGPTPEAAELPAPSRPVAEAFLRACRL